MEIPEINKYVSSGYKFLGKAKKDRILEKRQWSVSRTINVTMWNVNHLTKPDASRKGKKETVNIFITLGAIKGRLQCMASE